MDSNVSPANLNRTPVLEDAWQRFATYDKNAVAAQQGFIRQRQWILGLTVAATTLAVIYSVMEGNLDSVGQRLHPSLLQALENLNRVVPLLNQENFMGVLHALVVIAPIGLSILVAGAVKFNMGISWVMLRSSAEALKKEIYRYRTRVEEYSEDAEKIESRDVTLARKIKVIGKRLMETQVNQTGLEPYQGTLPPLYGTANGDDGFQSLTGEEYLNWRVDDQFAYYQKKAVRLSKELQQFQWRIYILGGVGTLLAAFGFDIWIAVSSALATAFTSYLEFKRVETNLISCNTAASDLYDIRTWWRALPESAKEQQANLVTLVKGTESVIQSENSGWVQEMRDALSEIYGEKEEAEETHDGRQDRELESASDSVLRSPSQQGPQSELAPTIVDQSAIEPQVQSNPA